MTATENSRFVRIDVQLIVEVDDPRALRRTAQDRIAADATLPEGERGRIESVVTHDTAEALAYLVDPSDLVGALPGIELTHTSWSAEHVDGGLDSLDADLYGDDGDHEEDFPGDRAGGLAGGGDVTVRIGIG